MNIVSSEFSKNAWNYFLLAKKIAYQNFHQNIDPEHLLLSIILNNKSVQKILELNKLNIKELEGILLTRIRSKGKMKYKQETLFIGDDLYKVFIKANQLRVRSKEVVISTEHILIGLIYDREVGSLILGK